MEDLFGTLHNFSSRSTPRRSSQIEQKQQKTFVTRSEATNIEALRHAAHTVSMLSPIIRDAPSDNTVSTHLRSKIRVIA